MFLGWASRSNNGRWFSRKSRGSPPVWVMGAGARGPAQGCRAVVDGVVGEARRGEARRRRGKAKVRQAERKAGMCVYVGGGAAAGNAGQSSGGEWNVSQEALSTLQRQNEGVCCWCCCSDNRQPAGELTCDSHSLTHILHSVTPHRLGRGMQLLYPVVSQPAAESLHIAHVVWLWRRERETESHTVAVSPLTPLKESGRGKEEDREEGRSGEGLTGQG